MITLFRYVRQRLSQPIISEQLKYLNTTTAFSINEKKWSTKSIPAPDEGVQGEKNIDVDSLMSLKKSIFPDENSDNLLFDGVQYANLPICNVRVTKNNTIITLTTDTGVVKLLRSCGVEGFKKAKKGTNIAAQATAISLSLKAIDKGFKTVRVRVQGLGPGRQAAVKGLQMGGLNIISLTDATRVSWNPPRPRKARRL